ncbi:hypothetical protein Fmac_026268 [Flemingia macrophylla]|uniref:Uncharacterized protein n=1 Tax=Flemingia macrophylla TaxID=520843 RepID=A0ABD1LED0_9FABA
MEEEKAAAYYDELTRKGEGAARFKQGLGFSAEPNDDVPKPGSALASSSSFLSKFVKASSSAPSESEKQARVQSVHDKLNKKPSSDSRVSSSRRRSRSRERHRESRRRSRSRERHRYGERERRRSRSVSPRRHRRSERGRVGETRKGKDSGSGIDYSKLIQGYDRMSSAERVKAKMKLQLSETAARDSEKGAGWERFEFNKDAPLDDEEVEVAEDDASLVKHIGQSFRFSAVEAKREEQIQAAHEEAMFGATTLPPPTSTDSEPEREYEKDIDKKELVTSLLSETVLAKQKGSWRDRVRQA